MAFSYQREDRGDAVIFRLQGNIGLEEVTRLREVFWNALNETNPACLILDFAGLRKVDPTVISLLVTTRNWAGKVRAAMILTGLTEADRQGLEQQNLDLYFDIAADPDTALQNGPDREASYCRPAEKTYPRD